MASQAGKFAIITGGSSGIGLELAKLAAAEGYDLLLAADTSFTTHGTELQNLGVAVETVDVDLSTWEGVDRLLAAAGGRQVDVLCANAGHGLGGPFLEQQPSEWRHVLDTNITGTIYLIQKAAQAMVARNEGRILITGSIAGHVAGSFAAVYNGSKAFVDSFSDALGNELKDTAVTVTCLKPGPVETEFFHRAELDDTKVGQSKKNPAEDTARVGWEAMKDGKRSVVDTWSSQLQTVGAKILGGGVSAEQHRGMAEPGSGTN